MFAGPRADGRGSVREVWREFADDYEVSNLGRVKGPTGMLKPYLTGLTNLRLPGSPKGYFSVYIKGTKKNERVSRLVAKAFVPNPRPDIFTDVDHINNDTHDNSWLNLQWLSKSLNSLKGKPNGKNCSAVRDFWGNGEIRYYKAYVTVGGKIKTKQPFATEAEASEVGRRMKREAFERLYNEATEPEGPKLKTTTSFC